MPVDPHPTFQHFDSPPPPEPSTSGSRHDPIVLPDDRPMWDSDNEDLQEIMEEACHDAPYLALLTQVLDKAEEMREESPPFLRCVACRTPIVVPTCDVGNRPILWRLAHCRHPLHLDCLAPLGRPHAISPSTKRPRYVHDPAATRIRSQKRHEQKFDHCPISRYEDVERMRTWQCPEAGCTQVQFSVLFHGDWYSNVHGMTMDAHFINGPTHL